MRVDSLFVTLLLTCLPLPAAAAEAPLLTLNNNPFSRPQMLEDRPPAAQPKAQSKAQPVDIELSATMLSATSPMVIADGELLGIGDSIKGLRLVEVMEGKAVFRGANGNLTFSVYEELQ